MYIEQPKVINTDILIIGSGIAGLRAAIEAAKSRAKVLVVTGNRAGQACNTLISGGGFACAGITTGDTPENHLQDTIISGQGINDPVLARLMTEGIKEQKEFLQAAGLPLAEPARQTWIATLTGTGHTLARMNYAYDLTGLALTRTLVKCARESGVTFLESALITQLLTEDGQVTGALGLDKAGDTFVIVAGSVILAAGGLGSLFERNDNAKDTAGYGYYLAYRAGACLQDMEFTQFEPLGLGQGRPALFFESLLVNPKIKLLDKDGQDVILKNRIHGGPQLTRDVLSTIIVNEIHRGGGVRGRLILDISGLSGKEREGLAAQIPRSAQKNTRYFPVYPTCHFHLGGIKIDAGCGTAVKGLFAAGEVCAGVHGANRLPGNALSEGLVFGYIAGKEAAIAASGLKKKPVIQQDSLDAACSQMDEEWKSLPGEGPGTAWRALQAVMWQCGGPGKEAGLMEEGLKRINDLKNNYKKTSTAKSVRRDAFRLRCGLLLAEIMLRAGKMRRESRGAHYRYDQPRRDDKNWRCNITAREDNGRMSFSRDDTGNID